MKSLSFSDFRKFFDQWENCLDNKETKLRDLINSNGLVMFFKKGDSLFGCPEEGRIVFAKMKSENGMEDANFVALNLSSDEPARHVIQSKDVNELKIIDLEDVISKIIGDK